jgi:hypothetical protein
MLYCNAMKFAAVAALMLSVAASAGAQDRRHPAPRRPSSDAPPPSRIVPPVLSTRLPAVLPPAPPPSPFAARPDTYLPRPNRPSPVYGGLGFGVPLYDPTPGIAGPPPLPIAPAPEQRVGTSPSAPEPPRAVEPVPEPPRMAALHGPDTFYVIPGCYMGNRPPIAARLPKGCDPAKLRTTPIR